MPTIKAQRNAWTSKDKDGKETSHPAFSVQANIDFGSNLQEMVKKYGESTVFKQALGAMTVAFQGWLRSKGAAGKSAAEIQTEANAWKPGEKRQAKSPQEKLKEILGAMSAEEKAAFLKEFKAPGK